MRGDESLGKLDLPILPFASTPFTDGKWHTLSVDGATKRRKERNLTR